MTQFAKQASVSTRGKLKYALVPEMAINKLLGMLQIPLSMPVSVDFLEPPGHSLAMR